MHFSLTRFRRFLQQSWYAGPGMAAAIALTMLFALTPCCEVSAALSAPASSVPDGHDHDQGHGDAHPHDTPSSDPCLAWVDNNLNALDTTTDLSIPERDPTPVLFTMLSMAAPSMESPPRDWQSCHSPPPRVPLYLRNGHLLL